MLHSSAFGGHPEREVTPPIQELFDFQRVFCAANTSVLVDVELRESVLALSDKAGAMANSWSRVRQRSQMIY